MKKPNTLLVLAFLFLLPTTSLVLAQSQDQQNNPYAYSYSSDTYVNIDLASPLSDTTRITIHSDSSLSISLFDNSESSPSFNTPYVRLEEPTSGTPPFLKLIDFSSSNSWYDEACVLPAPSYHNAVDINYTASCLFVPIGTGEEDLIFTVTSPIGNSKKVVIAVTVIP